MKKNINFLPALLSPLLFIFLFPYLSSADYLIELKNGRAIDVRDYKDEGEQIRFSSYGGETVIKKSLIKEIKKTEFLPVEGPVYTGNGTEGTASPAEDKKPEDKKTVVTSNAKNKADSIKERNEALSKEGEELGKKREELLKDIKQEGRLVLPTKKKELKKRMDSLETEIKEFNEKAEDIKSEERTIQPETKPSE